MIRVPMVRLSAGFIHPPSRVGGFSGPSNQRLPQRLPVLQPQFGLSRERLAKVLSHLDWGRHLSWGNVAAIGFIPALLAVIIGQSEQNRVSALENHLTAIAVTDCRGRLDFILEAQEAAGTDDNYYAYMLEELRKAEIRNQDHVKCGRPLSEQKIPPNVFPTRWRSAEPVDHSRMEWIQ